MRLFIRKELTILSMIKIRVIYSVLVSVFLNMVY